MPCNVWILSYVLYAIEAPMQRTQGKHLSYKLSGQGSLSSFLKGKILKSAYKSGLGIG